MTKELIEKIEDAYRRVRKIGPDAIYETELREVLRAAAAALSARQPSEDEREVTEAEIDKAARALHMAKCCSLSGDSPHDFPEVSELFAAGVVLTAVPRAAVPDAATDVREYLHAKCDCVPDLGPAHCHLCSADGSPVEWANCVAVQQVTDAPETVEVAFKTVEVERLGHLLVQLSPATPRNGAATVRRLMEEMNIKEVVS